MTTPPNPLPKISPETPGAPPAAAKSNTLAWILGGCGLVLVLAIIAGVLGLRMFIKNNVHIGPGGEMDVKLPGGGQMHTGKAKDIGIPIYPVTNPGAIGVEVTSPRQDLVMTAVTYFSADAVEKVDAWYGDNLSKDYVREGAGQKQTLPNDRRFPVPIESNSITYVLKNGKAMNVVALTQTGMTTKIVLMKTGSTAAQ
jgi:hypothetical protein